MRRLTFLTAAIGLLLFASSCATRQAASGPTEPARPPDEVLTLRTTAYCDSESCGNWETTHWGKTIIARGPNRGMPMTPGISITGEKRGPGMVAADLSIFPLGTTVSIPGYGVGVVSDSAGGLAENQLDLWFKDDDGVEEWGEQVHPVKVWR